MDGALGGQRCSHDPAMSPLAMNGAAARVAGDRRKRVRQEPRRLNARATPSCRRSHRDQRSCRNPVREQDRARAPGKARRLGPVLHADRPPRRIDTNRPYFGHRAQRRFRPKHRRRIDDRRIGRRCFRSKRCFRIGQCTRLDAYSETCCEDDFAKHFMIHRRCSYSLCAQVTPGRTHSTHRRRPT